MMASAELRGELLCSICLSVYTDPVNLSCGHNFCRECITLVLDTQRGSGAYSCPDCRATTRNRPPLQKNIALSNITRRLQSTPPTQGLFEVPCSYCVNAPAPAVKSCVLCEASLCEDHLKVHSKAEEHVLCEPTTNLESRKCSIHKKILEYYCIEDSTCICVTCCLVGEHKGHQVETLADFSKKKKQKEKLNDLIEKLNSKCKETEEEIKNHQEHVRQVTDQATDATERLNLLFSDVKKQVEVLQKNALRSVSWHLHIASFSANELINRMEIKRNQLAFKINYLEKLCNMSGPLPVLKVPDGEDNHTGFRDPEVVEIHNVGDLDVQSIFENTQSKIHDTIKNINVWIFKEDPTDLLLDMNTNATNVRVSEDQRTLSFSEMVQDVPDTPQRFKQYQVLSTKSFTSGRHYWEMETSGSGVWRIGVCYPSMDRKGTNFYIGDNNKSWSLSKLIHLAVVHDHHVDKLRMHIQSNKYGIYLDYDGGQLSFYELGDTIKHLHTFTTTFTEPLHPAFHVSNWCSHLLNRSNSDVWIRIINNRGKIECGALTRNLAKERPSPLEKKDSHVPNNECCVA
ncbi:E3 ubiquitin-protein ligase TRIM39-like [Anomaloglossus baeobatrachus]|uniref:E3 ubiquitin-protein ligase TRIM39-like n=1 Tax=Anomaloglossus baeobatrachus TaxID=238106 RepID=UPI003F5074FA